MSALAAQTAVVEPLETETLPAFSAKASLPLPAGVTEPLFMAYHETISRQFKFTQQKWVNNPAFPVAGNHGNDPVIGQSPCNPNGRKLPKQWNDYASDCNNNLAFDGFTEMKGRDYVRARPDVT